MEPSNKSSQIEETKQEEPKVATQIIEKKKKV